MRRIDLPGGLNVPVIGLGTWNMGEDPARAAEETRALHAGLDAGMTLVDTAEMYGDGRTETFLGTALSGRRDEVVLVSKVYPHHASKARMARACEDSLKRLRTDRLDLYLLHWPGNVPIAETVAGMEDLKARGKIRAWGVSNFDVAAMEELMTAGGTGCATNQVLYNVTRRGPDFDLAPWLAARGIPLMAYSPIEQGRLPAGGALAEVAARHGVSSFQVALAWVIRAGAFAIPKAASLAHVAENRAAAEIVLSAEDMATIDRAFAAPTRKVPLAML
jgi:diketogulonate reductase-like aldo/keto reductase